MVVTNVVNKGATFKCPHTGTGTVSIVSSTLTVGGNPILTTAEASTMTIVGCTLVTSPALPCLLLFSVSGGSSVLKKDGVAVSLNTDTYTTTGTTTGSPPYEFTMIISSTQIKLRA